MNERTGFWSVLTLIALLAGCAAKPQPYGVEAQLRLDGRRRVWAVCPVINLSGQQEVDPILQADLVYQQLQEVRGLTVLPVNRVVGVFAALGIDKIHSQADVEKVCRALGCDGLVIATVTIFDPFNPPKLGASVSLMQASGFNGPSDAVDPDALTRQAAPSMPPPMPRPKENFVQVVGMYDAANGSTRQQVLDYAAGRSDPLGPMGEREYFQSMSRYCGFVYHELIGRLLEKL